MCICMCVHARIQTQVLGFLSPHLFIFPLPVTQSLWTVRLSFLTQLLSSCVSGEGQERRGGGAFPGFHVPATSFSAKGEVDPSVPDYLPHQMDQGVVLIRWSLLQAFFDVLEQNQL